MTSRGPAPTTRGLGGRLQELRVDMMSMENSVTSQLDALRADLAALKGDGPPPARKLAEGDFDDTVSSASGFSGRGGSPCRVEQAQHIGSSGQESSPDWSAEFTATNARLAMAEGEVERLSVIVEQERRGRAEEFV